MKAVVAVLVGSIILSRGIYRFRHGLTLRPKRGTFMVLRNLDEEPGGRDSWFYVECWFWMIAGSAAIVAGLIQLTVYFVN